MVTVFIRTILIYAFLLISMRLVGKRQIGELQISELITTFMLSELAVLPISDTDIPILYALLPILTLLSLEIIISFATSQCVPLRRIFFGAPSVLIYKGRLNEKELKKLRLGLGELLSELRLKNIAGISDVRYAILEDNGKLSVFTNTDASPLTPKQAGVPAAESGIALPVLISGLFMKDCIRHVGIDEAWIERFLNKHNLKKSDVLLMTVDEQKHTAYVLKNSPNGKFSEADEK